jgi:hypothetical protein
VTIARKFHAITRFSLAIEVFSSLHLKTGNRMGKTLDGGGLTV